jgi:PAS domain S-box-containing protein
MTQHIQAINGKCALMLGYGRQDLIDKELTGIFPDSASRDNFIDQIKKTSEIGDIELLLTTRDGVVRQFLVSASLSPGDMVICSAIDITERKLAERVIQKAREDLEKKVKERSEELMRANDGLKAEIQERKRFEATLQLANRKLSTLSSITHHDILNQITAIGMYLSLAEEMVNDSTLLEHLKKIEQSTALIQKQIQFARDYQDIGTNAPQWQNVGIVINSAIAGFDLGGIRVEKDVGNLEIFADLLLEKVFFNFVDNVVRHGGKATVVRFSAQETDDGVTIYCSDDGVGVPEGLKEGIFKREYYRNSGYGLYLAAEILSITGLSIGESGEPGNGAQFEIRVPKDAYGFGEDTP